MASLFTGFQVEKYVTCQSGKSDLGWHCFRFSPCLMRKRVDSCILNGNDNDDDDNEVLTSSVEANADQVLQN